MVTQDEVIKWVEETPLEDMAEVLTVLADKVYQHRLQNDGYVPMAVFEQLLGPVTVSVQLVHEVVNPHGKSIGFALRDREANEAGEVYEGQYHNVCTSWHWADESLEVALQRNDKDAFQGTRGADWEYLGVTVHHEVPRRNMDLTFMFRRKVFESDLETMNGKWVWVSAKSLYGDLKDHPLMVTSNIHQLRWVMDENRAWFGVLLDSFPSELRK